MDTKLFQTPSKYNTRIEPESGQQITVERLKEMLPANTNIAVTEEIVEMINRVEDDTGLSQELVEEDIMSYMHLLGANKGTSIKQLVNAIKYCNLKRNYENKEAWAIVFPDKYNQLVVDNKQVDSHVSMYNATKLVTAIDKEMLIPVSMTYSGYFHKAVQELYKIGVLGKGGKDAYNKDMTVTPMVKVQALKELTAITKPIEDAKLQVTVNPGEEALSVQAAMNAQLEQIVAHQKKQVDAGVNVIDAQVIGINFDAIGVGSGE